MRLRTSLNPSPFGGTCDVVGSERKSSRNALATAIALHAALVGALFLVSTSRPRPAPPAAPLDSVAIEIEGPRTEATPSSIPAASLASLAPVPVPVPVPVPLPSADQAPSDSSPPSPPSPIATILPAPPPAIGLSLGAPNPFVTSAAAGREQPIGAAPAAPDDRRPRTAAESKRAVEAALREPARARERELGLGPDGPVLAALSDATSASTAPVTGRAVFIAVADGTGMIVGIDVVECDGARSGWANAAAIARSALEGKKLRMPSSATRAELRIEVTSAWKLPSGHDPGTDVAVFGVPVAKGEGKQSTKVSILDPIPKLRTVEIAKDVNVVVPTINVDVLMVAGDPANVGARPRRIVHTRLIDSKVL